MGKFAIACPVCGNYVTAYNGIRGLIQNIVTCHCGHEIDIHAERMTSVNCPHCSSTVVYDQGKKAPKCPVCKEEILPVDVEQMISFKCPECGVGLKAAKGTKQYICPICDHGINVPREYAKIQYAKQGAVSQIKYEGDNETFIWKHPIEDFNTGSQLIVHASQEVILFRDGQALDTFGPGKWTLETQNLPVMSEIYKLPTGNTKGTFHSEVYYINKVTQIGIRWGTDSKIRFFDPGSGMHIELGAYGKFNIQVVNSRKLLLKIVGTEESLKREQLLGNGRDSGFFKSLIAMQTKTCLASAIKSRNINILEVDEHTEELSEVLRKKINEKLSEYGLYMPEFLINHIVLPDESEPDSEMGKDVARMRKQYRDIYLMGREEEITRIKNKNKKAEAEGEAEVTRIRAEAKADAYKQQAEAEAFEMRMKEYTYQQETARKVGTTVMKHGNSGGVTGELVQAGVALSVAGGISQMAKEAVAPVLQNSIENREKTKKEEITVWDCSCGEKKLTSRFCPKCGKGKPTESNLWDCVCGAKNLSDKFCPNCGKSRPQEWNCKCGRKNILSNFCPNCGSGKPQEMWDCECGAKNNMESNFCPECGKERGKK